MALSEAFRARAGEIKARYPMARSAMMPLLYLAQAEEGAITRDGIRAVAEALGLHTAEVDAVVSFYTMYRPAPCGRYVLAICTNLSCALAGARELIDQAVDMLGERARHDVSEDGLVSLHEEECLAACDAAPVVQVNFANYDRVTPEGLVALIDALGRDEPPAPSRGAFPGEFTKASRILAGLEPETGR